MSAFERGQRPAPSPALSPRWASALAAAGVAVVLLPAAAGLFAPSRGDVLSASVAPLRIRVVETPSVGFGPTASMPGDALIADSLEGP
jgi:hypothetical protein